MKKINQKFSFCILKTFTEKIFLSFLLLCSSQLMLAQVSENFSDGDFVANPAWLGNDSAFSVKEAALQLEAPAEAGTKYLSTASLAINQAVWMCRVRLDFNPSSSNFTRIYLTADQPDLTQPLNGYYVMIGGSTDEVSLFNQRGSTLTKIIDGLDGLVNTATVDMNIKVTRDENGNWTLFQDVELTGSYTEVGHVQDAEHHSSAFTGIYCRYTATRSNDFYFDNIDITGDPYIPPISIRYKDIIITEIFADPTPTNDLPDAEFIELYNRSNNALTLNNVVVTDGTTTAALPAEKIQPGEYVIICSSGHRDEFAGFGRTIELSNFPSLNNAGETLSLLANEILVDVVRFNTDWYHDRMKAEGGWTLELIDVKNFCGEENNWSAADDLRGGTPGSQNSISADKPDITPPILISCIPHDASLVLKFNERLNNTLPSLNTLSITPEVEITDISFLDDRERTLVVKLGASLQDHMMYRLAIENINDCNGNNSDHTAIEFALPELADSMDVLINEILFNPHPTGVDFVELVNASDKHINIRDWSLAKKENDLVDKHLIVEDDYILKPKAYLLLTTNGDIVKSEYLNSIVESFLVAKDLPPMNDDAGNIILVNDLGKIIDEFHYHQEMHAAFVKNDEGISLERISLKSSTQNPDNWKSASETVGFATPGYQNSMATFIDADSKRIKVDPQIFKPMSGMADFTQIHYSFAQGGLIGNVKILDSYGRPVRALANNALLGTEGFFRWDGDRDDGVKARVGNYMICFEVFDNAGSVTTYRRRVAIAY